MSAFAPHSAPADLELRHYSPEPDVQLDRAFDYTAHRRFDKPAGFWVSVPGEQDWKSWCEAEEFRTDTLANDHVVTLTDEARVLHLASMDALREFTNVYGAELGIGRRTGINWDVLTLSYDGIIIAPYQWEARFNHDVFWYYSWDCASGCIWNLDAIATVIPSHNRARRRSGRAA